MLFLLNEVVIDLDRLTALPTAPRFRGLSLEALMQLGQELYAEEPLLHHDRPDRAQRLAALVAAKAPGVNAALFVAPAFGGQAADVSVRLAAVPGEVMAELAGRQADGRLDTLSADRKVWRRLAA